MRLMWLFLSSSTLAGSRDHAYDGVSALQMASTAVRRLTSTGAGTKPYVKSLMLNGVNLEQPVIRHEDIMGGGELVFEMSAVPEKWGSGTLVG